MSTQSPSPARFIYLAASKLRDPVARKEYLDDACNSNPALRQQLDRLLDAEADGAESPLQLAMAGLGYAAEDDLHNGGRRSASHEDVAHDSAEVDETADLRTDVSKHPMIGRYKLLQELGHGGMGIVYMAQQTAPVKRKVAVKIIKPGMDSREVIVRFQAERQALALMDHPNIARVLDAGTTDEGRPYFVMEMVRGIPITKFCDEKNLGVKDRLKLFLDVCKAVQHAHQKAIIHRDLKPGNILVTLHDGVPVVKVIDFGVAKALNQELTEQTLFTQFSQMVGTPLYMSPEQAELSGLDVDTRSDVFSLGVVLYELLTGTTPFDRDTISHVGFDEMRRIIREDDPPRPSDRVSTLKAQAESTLDDQRHLRSGRMRELFSDELDWIVMRALEKDRTRRYESASALAADIGRHLKDEPVEACPPSLSYRVRKVSRRYKGLLATAATVILALFVGTGVAMWQAVQAKQERAEAERNMMAAMDAVERLLANVGNPQLANAPGLQETWASILKETIAFYDRFKADSGSSPEIDYRAAKVFLEFGHLMAATQPYSVEVIQSYRRGLKLAQPIVLQEPKRNDFRELLAELHLGCAKHFWMPRAIVTDEHTAQMEMHYRSALQQYEHLDLENPGNHQYREMQGFIFDRMATFYNARSPDDRREEELLRRASALGFESNVSAARQARRAGDRKLETQFWRKEIAIYRADPSNYGTDHRKYPEGNLLPWSPNVGNLLAEEFPAEAEWLWQEMIKKYDDAISAFPSHHEHRRHFDLVSGGYANFLLHPDRCGQAISKLDTLVTSNSAFHCVRAKVLGRLGSAEDERRRLDDSIRRYAAHGEYYFERANFLKNRGDLVTALSDLNQLLELDQNHRKGYQTRGIVWHEMGEYQRAIDDYTKGIESLAGIDEGTLEKRAAAYYELGQYAAALADLNHAIDQRPDVLSALICIAPEKVATCPDSEFRVGILQLADRAVHVNNNSSSALLHRGLLLDGLNQTERAEADIENAHSASDFPAALNELAWWIVTMRESRPKWTQRAVEFAEEAVSLKPDAVSYWNTLGHAQYRVSNYEGAIQSLEKSNELSDGRNFGYDGIFLAMAHWQLGNKDKARKMYDQSVAWREKNASSEELDRFYVEAEELFAKSKVGNGH